MSDLETPTDDQLAIELAGRIAAGDRRGEEELVELYGRGLRFLLLRLTGDPAVADDLYQETFRIVLEKLRHNQLESPSRLAAFLRGTARNLAFADGRRQTRYRQTETTAAHLEPEDPAPSQLQRVLAEEDRQLVRKMLAELRSDRDRQILHRFHIDEDDKDSICEDLGLTSLQFNLVLFRARDRFRKLLERSMSRLRLAEISSE